MSRVVTSYRVAIVALFVLLNGLLFFAPTPTVSAAPPRCYNHDGTQDATCQDAGVQLLDDRCYTESRGGPNGVLQGYNETSCIDPTNRSQSAICFEEYNGVRTSACGAAGGSGSGSRTYRDLNGNAVSSPRRGACYLRTSGQGDTNIVYAEQPADRCMSLGESASEWQANNGGTSQPGYVTNDCERQPITKDNCGIVRYIVIFIQLLSGIATVVIVASIIYGGIQYSSAGSDPQKISSAKGRIRNAIIALVFFIFGFALLNYLVPGGVL